MSDFPTDDDGNIVGIISPVSLSYDFTPGVAGTRFLRELEQRRFVAEKSGADGDVYIPPRGTDPSNGQPTDTMVDIPHTGIVTTYCVVNIPFAGAHVDVPYVQGTILLDGTDLGIMHLLQEVDPAEVRPGMRVEAVWVDDDQMEPNMTSIKYFRPTGQPDAPYEDYKEHI